jgi:hypothetical protein
MEGKIGDRKPVILNEPIKPATPVNMTEVFNAIGVVGKSM